MGFCMVLMMSEDLRLLRAREKRLPVLVYQCRGVSRSGRLGK